MTFLNSIVDAIRYGWGYWLLAAIFAAVLAVAFRMSRRM